MLFLSFETHKLNFEMNTYIVNFSLVWINNHTRIAWWALLKHYKQQFSNDDWMIRVWTVFTSLLTHMMLGITSTILSIFWQPDRFQKSFLCNCICKRKKRQNNLNVTFGKAWIPKAWAKQIRSHKTHRGHITWRQNSVNSCLKRTYTFTHIKSNADKDTKTWILWSLNNSVFQHWFLHSTICVINAYHATTTTMEIIPVDFISDKSSSFHDSQLNKRQQHREILLKPKYKMLQCIYQQLFCMN